jgi:hypothetical protein
MEWRERRICVGRVSVVTLDEADEVIEVGCGGFEG